MKLHNYQERGRKFIHANNTAILAVGMGLGKTATTIHAIDDLSPNSALIVAPKRVAETVWLQEAEAWGLNHLAERMAIVAGTPKKRQELLNDTSRPIKIIGRDSLKDVQNMEFDMCIMDELTSFKNPTSQRFEFMKSVRADKRIGLTGTFLTNGAIDIYGQADVMFNTNNPLGRNFYSWRASYFYDAAPPKVRWKMWKLLKGISIETVIEPIRGSIFTLDSNDWLDIPEVETIVHQVQLSKTEQANYDDMNTMLVSDFGAVYSEEQKFSKLATIVNDFAYKTIRNKLGQIVSSETFRGKHGTKLKMIADFVERAVSEGEQVLLFYAFTEEAIWLSEMFKKVGITFCSIADPNFLTKWNNNEVDVLIAHPKSAGHGLNLQHGGRIIVWSTLTYDYEAWAQSNARLARQGQKRGVKIHYFLANNTIEVGKLKSLRAKEKFDREFIELTK